VDRSYLEALLDAVARGEVEPADAAERLARLPATDIGFARVDTHRELRTGLPEVIFGPGKTPSQIRAIAAELLATPGGPVLVTKTSREAYDAVASLAPDAVWHETSGTIVVRPSAEAPRATVAVLAAGTSDLPVAQEAIATLEACALKVDPIFDVGVAGVHRLLAVVERLRAADVAIVVAGMDGALPGVVAGLTPAPVVAVPTSVGYGSSFGGLAALLTMLNACAPGIGVTNIDNGFGAAVVASRIVTSRADRHT
jgi:pyridinium-3,5-biscarboxylic acid mononucleotide synthase